MTEGQLKKIATALVSACADRDGRIDKKTEDALVLLIAEIRKIAQIAPLAARVAEVEKRRVPKYLGVWQANNAYEEGALVSFDGSLWHANTDTDSRPGTNHDAWTLCVKRGRDADRFARTATRPAETHIRTNGQYPR